MILVHYPVGDDFKREYEEMEVKIKEAGYLVNCARIFLEEQQGYDPDVPITVSKEDSKYFLEYATKEFKASAILGFRYTIEQTLQSFMYHWFHYRILK